MINTGTDDQLFTEVTNNVIEWRRHFHRNPELSFEEYETSQFVYDTLMSFVGLNVTRPTKTSVVASLIGSQPGKVLGLRADMDALPIQEETDIDFDSVNPGVMHACGHDGHTAMLLGAAKVLSQRKDQIKGKSDLFFSMQKNYRPVVPVNS